MIAECGVLVYTHPANQWRAEGLNVKKGHLRLYGPPTT